MNSNDLVEDTDRDESRRTPGVPSPRSGVHGDPSGISAERVERVVRRSAALAHARYAVGIELLPFRLVGVLVDQHGVRLAEEHRVVYDMGVPAVVAAAAALVESLLPAVPEGGQEERIALGFQLGGPVETGTGQVLFYRKRPPEALPARAVRWENHQPLGRLLTEATDLPTVVENDGNAFAAYQQWFGAGREVSRFVVMLIREGVGGAYVHDGRLSDAPLEVGNIPVFPESGRQCDCGNLGCLEATAGINGILDTIHSYTGELVEGIVGAAELAERPEVGAKAREAFTGAGVAVAKGMGILVNLFRPQRIVLYAPAVMVDRSGPAGESFLDRVDTFRRYCHGIYAETGLAVEPLHPFDGAHGAALIALQRCFGIGPNGPVDAAR